MFPKAMVGLGRDYLIQNPDLTHLSKLLMLRS